MTETSRIASFARFSWGVLAYNLGVILWGAFVRATGSGAGCGSHWPDCNGEILPRAESIETAIELTHRLTSGLALVLVLVQVGWALRLFERGHLARRAAIAGVILMLTEAALGAGIVLLEYVADDASAGRAAWMALHLVNTFLLVAALALTAWWADAERASRALDAGGGVGWYVAIGALALVVTGMAGAVTALGDTLFPSATLAEGLAADASPTAHFLVRLRVIHPIVATGTFLYLVMASALISAARPDARVRRAALALVVSLAVQMGAGLLNLALLAPVWMQLVHLLLADVAWIALVLLGASALGAPRASAVTRAAIA
ncbi:COX15/CtaA family protein [Sandaracinus amylolyticus]|uniref:Heme A synthase, cytochrome oxidase biogenesis protein Cox15-CtaA n=1 Tax=Sandaracinus amylolyticus TaxID=927083 RepID=A0A0F6W6T9_9BACT|nr:COX15/CtaA family protein [Sandaracinus amylolyticus]AKF08746.1 Heme A synthase, cytochrome oxidase biogenesis protein Cox15-CtaA [Sandaracinus amylolyticus]